MRYVLSITLILTASLAGCASHAPPEPSQRQVVTKQWNDTRSAVLVGLAHDQYLNGELDKSRATIDEALKLSPDDAKAHVLSARLYMEAGQLEAAERELAAASALSPASPEPDYLSGVIYQRWDQPQRALSFYERASSKAPAELAYVIARAEMLVALDRRSDALALLMSKMAYFEHSSVIRDEVGLLLIQEGRYLQAAEMLRRAAVLSPDEPTVREHLATALCDAHRFAECTDVLTPLLATDLYANRGDLWAMLGECRIETGQPAEALHDLQQAVRLLPPSAGLWLSIARAQMQMNDLAAADSAVHRSLELDGDNSQAQLLLGYLMLRQCHDSEALSAFRQAVNLSPGDTVAICMVGFTLEKLGQPRQAIACFRQALQIDPHDAMATQLMAQLDPNE